MYCTVISDATYCWLALT